MGKATGSVSTIELTFRLDVPDEIAPLGETVAKALLRIAVSHVRQHGNGSESLSLLKSHLESAGAAANIFIKIVESDGSTGVRLAYALNQRRDKFLVVVEPIGNPTTLLEPLAPEWQD